MRIVVLPPITRVQGTLIWRSNFSLYSVLFEGEPSPPARKGHERFETFVASSR